MFEPIPDLSNKNNTGDLTVIHVNKDYIQDKISGTTYADYDLPKEEDYLFVVEKKFEFDNIAFSASNNKISAIKSDHSSLLTIDTCTFDSLSVRNENVNGGAINLENCGFLCMKSQFTNCSSATNNAGRGGAMYIVVNEDVQENLKIEDCNFKDCSAVKGGGIYIHSILETNKIVIKYCNFINNHLLAPQNGDAVESSGSAIYLDSRATKIFSCKFKKNEGKSSIGIIDHEATKAELKGLLSKRKSAKKPSLVIKNSEFEITADSKSSIFYLHKGSDAVPILIDDCIFTGDLNKNANHIELSSVSKMKSEKPTFNIKNCKFASDKEKAVKVNVNGLTKFDVRQQKFNFNGHNENEKSANFYSKIAQLASLASAALVIVIAVAVYIHKKSNTDNNEPLNISNELD